MRMRYASLAISVDVEAGFFGHAELTLAESGLDSLGSIAGHGDFKIMDQGGAIHGDPGNEPAAHEVTRTGPRPTLMTWPPRPQRMARFCFTRAMNGGEQVAQILGGKNSAGRESRNFVREACAPHRPRKIADIDLLFAGAGQRVGATRRPKRQRLNGIDAYMRVSITLREDTRRRKWEMECERGCHARGLFCARVMALPFEEPLNPIERASAWAGVGLLHADAHLLGSALRNRFARHPGRLRAQVDDPVRLFDDIQIVLNDQNGVAEIHEPLEDVQELAHSSKCRPVGGAHRECRRSCRSGVWRVRGPA